MIDTGSEVATLAGSGRRIRLTRGHEVEEVDAIFAHLRAHGATIAKAPRQASWGGYSGYFVDPDGHCWEVAFNPHWTVRDDGRIALTA